MPIRCSIFALCVLLLFTACVKHEAIHHAETTEERVPVPAESMSTTENTTVPMPTKPTLTLEPVTTATETITLYFHNGTGEEICTKVTSREIQEVYQIEKLVDGEWQKIGSRMDELMGDSSTYQVKEVESVIDHEPGETTTFTIPVEAWCGALLTPGEYRVPIRYGTWYNPLEYDDAWYFTVTE